MTDEEKAEKYADKILSDSKYPFILNKQKVKAYIIKVYLDSLKCCEEAYNKGLAEGRKKEHDKWCSNPFWVMQLEAENAKLKTQIEDMKNVGNCEHVLNCARWVQQHISSNKVTCCKGCSEWELKKMEM